MTGRPTKLDDLTAKRILDAIAAGCSRTAAAEAARVGRATLMRWLRRGLEGEQPFRDFRDRMKKAEAEAESAMVAVIRSAAEGGTWQAAAWWLERRRPKTYALRRETRDVPSPLVIGGSGSTHAEDVAVLESLLAAARSQKGGA